jgi:hypothetical protein
MAQKYVVDKGFLINAHSRIYFFAEVLMSGMGGPGD